MSYVYQEYPKWVSAEGVEPRIVKSEAEEAEFYDALPPIELSGSPDTTEPAPKRRGRPPKKVPE